MRMLTLATLVVAVLAAGPAEPQAAPQAEAPPGATEQGLLLRVGGDVALPAGQRVDAVVAIGGNARVAGSAARVVVIDGTALLEDARVGELVVIDGHATLRGTTAISGDIVLTSSDLERDPGVTVGGSVRTQAPWHALGFWITGVLLPLGLLLAFVAAGLAIAALVPHGVRRAEAALTRDLGKTVVASLLLWIAVPIAVIVSFAAVLTIPAGIGVLFFVLPAIGFFGYVVVGIRIGDEVVGAVRDRNDALHPYVAALIGIPLLAVLGLFPVIGGPITVLSGVIGGGAILIAAWRTVRERRALPPAMAVAGG